MDYQIRTHPRAKKLTLRLDKTGQPVITVPRFTPQFLVKKFVTDNQGWIARHRIKQQQAKTKFLSDDSVMLFGKMYQLKDQPTNKASQVRIKGEKVLVMLAGKKTTTQRQKLINEFLKNTASHYLVPRTHQLAKKMAVNFKKITLRAQTTRWGSCSSEGNLSFNWKLVHFPPKVIDYVIIHELAHLKHLNHSARFWQFVEQFDPDYRLQRGWLKRQGVAVG